MEAFTQLTSIAASLPEANVDTDIIFPARFLLLTEKTGLGKYAFYERRYGLNGVEIVDFPLNREPYRSSQILLAGDNFGCGSSREQAPWALRDLGFRSIISTGFGEIFYSNCFRNGMLPIVITAEQLAILQRESAAEKPLTIDLINRCLRPHQDKPMPFQLADWRRNALINGWDEISMILNQEADQIAAFEARQRQLMPWLYDIPAGERITS